MKRLSNLLLKNSLGIILLLLVGWFVWNLYANTSTYQKMLTTQQIMNPEWEPDYYKIEFSGSDTVIHLERTARIFYVHPTKGLGLKFNRSGSPVSIRIPAYRTHRFVYLKGADSLGLYNFGEPPITVWIAAY